MVNFGTGSTGGCCFWAGTAAQNNPAVPEELRDDFAMIRRNVELEAKLIDDLLDLTRIGRGKIQLHLEPVDVHQVVHNAIQVLSAEELAAKQLDIELKLDARLHHVRLNIVGPLTEQRACGRNPACPSMPSHAACRLLHHKLHRVGLRPRSLPVQVDLDVR